MGLQAEIWAWRLGVGGRGAEEEKKKEKEKEEKIPHMCESIGHRPLLGPQDWDLGLKAGIWASTLRYGPGGLQEGGAEEKEEKEKEEKIPHVCESIGHRPLWGRCPAPLPTSTTAYLSRARVPLTI